ncbi:MAG: hypothetical protein ACYCXG_02220 [Acidiferrobacter sp.]
MMRTYLVVAAVLSAPLIVVALAQSSYAELVAPSSFPSTLNTPVTGNPSTTNAAIPAVPGGPGNPATPAIPGNPVAQQATEHAEYVHQHDRIADLARDRARLTHLTMMAAHYAAAGQQEKMVTIQTRIRKLRARMEQIHDHIQRFRAVELSEHASVGTEMPVRNTRVDIDRPLITRPHIIRPEIVRPEIERPDFGH